MYYHQLLQILMISICLPSSYRGSAYIYTQTKETSFDPSRFNQPFIHTLHSSSYNEDSHTKTEHSTFYNIIEITSTILLYTLWILMHEMNTNNDKYKKQKPRNKLKNKNKVKITIKRKRKRRKRNNCNKLKTAKTEGKAVNSNTKYKAHDRILDEYDDAHWILKGKLKKIRNKQKRERQKNKTKQNRKSNKPKPVTTETKQTPRNSSAIKITRRCNARKNVLWTSIIGTLMMTTANAASDSLYKNGISMPSQLYDETMMISMPLTSFILSSLYSIDIHRKPFRFEAVMFMLMLCMTPNNAVYWNRSSTSMPLLTDIRQMAVGVYNDTVWLLGGNDTESQILEINPFAHQITQPPNVVEFASFPSQQYYQFGSTVFFAYSVDFITVFDLAQHIISDLIPTYNANEDVGCIVVNDEYLFQIGGYGGGSVQDTTFVYNFSSNEWFEGDQLWYPIQFHSCVIITVVDEGDTYDRLFLFGGKDDTGTAMQDIYFLETSTESPASMWYKHGLSLSIARYKFSTVVHGEAIYVVGGLDNNGNAIDMVEIMNTTNNMDLYNDSFLHDAKYSSGIAILNNTLFSFGGSPTTDNEFFQWIGLPLLPTQSPTKEPTQEPTVVPSSLPTSAPSASPSQSSMPPSQPPSTSPSQSVETESSTLATDAPFTPPPTACIDYDDYKSLDGTNETTDIKHSSMHIMYPNDTYLSNMETYLSTDNEDYLVYYDINCTESDADGCFVGCYGAAHCTFANVLAAPNVILQDIMVMCPFKRSCVHLKLKIISAFVNTASILCSASFSCHEVGVTISAISDIQISIECDEIFSCNEMTLNLTHYDLKETNSKIKVNISCYVDHACDFLKIETDDSPNIFINLSVYRYSQDIEINYHFWQNILINCGSDTDRRYIRYDTNMLLDVYEVLQFARFEYDSTRRLPCEDIHILCSNNSDFERECTYKYELSTRFDIMDLLNEQNKANCYWLDIVELYKANCKGTCGDTMIYLKYPQKISLDLIFEIQDDKTERRRFIAQNDTTKSYEMCLSYFGSINTTEDSLSSVDAIFYYVLSIISSFDASIIHDITIPPETILRDDLTQIDCINEGINTIKMITNVSIASAEDNERIINAIFDTNGEFINKSQILLSDLFGFRIKLVNVDSIAINEFTAAGIKAWIFVLVIVCVAICIPIAVIVYRKKETAKKEALTTYISNPMVITLGIGKYETEPIKPMVDGYFRNLDGIDKDIHHSHALFGEKLKYTVYPKQEKLEWRLDEMMQFLYKKADELQSNINKIYDGLVVIISCHGITDYIVTSDYKKVKKSAIHRLFTSEKPEVRSVPRLFIFDCCDGEEDLDARNVRDDTLTADGETNDEDGTQQNKGIQKSEEKAVQQTEDNLLVPQKQFTRTYSKNIELSTVAGSDGQWLRNEQNPDFRLITIHAANEGFQSKLDIYEGSYVITAFTNKLSQNIDNDNKKWLFEIFDDIQQELHSRGIQHTVNTFNDNMRYLKFLRNERTDVTIHPKNSDGSTEIVFNQK